MATIGRQLVRVDMASRNNFGKVCRAELAENSIRHVLKNEEQIDLTFGHELMEG